MLRAYQGGLTVLEILVSVAIGAVLILSLSGVTGQAFDAKDNTQAKMQLLQDGRFAMDRMISAISGSKTLLLPLADNPGTTWREHVREQTVPASAPESGSTLATAVLAVVLPASRDIDLDGWSDANTDKDFLDLNRNGSRDLENLSGLTKIFSTMQLMTMRQELLALMIMATVLWTILPVMNMTTMKMMFSTKTLLMALTTTGTARLMKMPTMT